MLLNAAGMTVIGAGGSLRSARGARLSRSAILSAALKDYVARHAPDEVTEAMNRVCDEVGDRAERQRPVPITS